MRKKLLIIALLICAARLNAQESQVIEKGINYADLNIESKATDYTFYTSKDGSIYKIGDKLKIGQASGGAIASASGNNVSKTNKSFAFIYTGDGIMAPLLPANATITNTESEIVKIIVAGTKRSGVQVVFKSKAASMGRYTIYVENAIESGELHGFGMSSDEALMNLKKAKDKLDLGLITPEEYETTKSELKKYIK